MKNLHAPEIWYIIGSQHLYGEQTLRQVAAHSHFLDEPQEAAFPLITVVDDKRYELYSGRTFAEVKK
jgi:L-arabinose isomerase